MNHECSSQMDVFILTNERTVMIISEKKMELKLRRSFCNCTERDRRQKTKVSIATEAKKKLGVKFSFATHQSHLQFLEPSNLPRTPLVLHRLVIVHTTSS